jgi:hypothetical protein
MTRLLFFVPKTSCSAYGEYLIVLNRHLHFIIVSWPVVAKYSVLKRTRF